MEPVNGIVSMDPDNLREVDGVVFDLASYARHCEPAPEPAPESISAVPSPVFLVDPVHLGWYAAVDGQDRVPIMGGCLPPNPEILEQAGQQTIVLRQILPMGSGSGSGSYLTSYRTSWFGSGSGSFVLGSAVFLAGGYGLELI